MQKTITSLLAGVLLVPAVAFSRTETQKSRILPSGLKEEMLRVKPNLSDIRASELLFIENIGQVRDQYGNDRPDIRYSVQGRGMDIFLGSNTIHYQFKKELSQRANNFELDELPNEEPTTKYASYRMDVSLVGANPNPKVRTEDKTIYYERYFLPGANEAGVRAHSYKKVVFEDVYPNIDWVVYSNGRTLEYDFHVKPGGNVSDIKVQYNGAVKIKLNADGSLTAETPMGAVTENAPYSFQQENNKKVASAFSLNGNVLSFRTASYNSKGTLVIDPIVSWSTYIGGPGDDYLGSSSSNCSDIIAVDHECNLYASGRTSSRANIATKGSYQDTFSSGSDQFLAKFHADGTIGYVTYYPISIYYPQAAVDQTGAVYIAGGTMSSGANPATTTTNAYQRLNAGDYDAFIAKFNAEGDREWATFYGGPRRDQGGTIRCDNDNNVIIAGGTQFPNQQVGGSNNLSTPGAYKLDTIGKQDGFIAKFSSTGALRWATYFGGTEGESIGSLDCDDNGNVYVGGATSSPNIHTIGNPMSGASDAFLAKFKADGTHLWTRYVGGEGSEGNLKSVHVDKKGNILVTSTTNSATGIATSGAWRGTYSGNSNTATNAALIKVDSNGSTVWGTYLFGGPMSSMATDPHNDIWIVAYPQYRTGWDSLMSTPDAHKDTSNLYNREGWIGKISEDGSSLLYGSFWGSVGEEYFLSVAVDKSGGVYTAGYTVGGVGLGTPGAYQDTAGGGLIDGFIVRFTDCSVLRGTDVTADGPISFCQGESVTLKVETPAILGCLSYQWQLNGTNIAGSNSETYEARVSGDYSVVITNASGECRDTSVNVVSVTVHDLPEPIIDRNGDVLSTDSFASYQWYRNNAPISGATDRSYTATRDGNYKVTVVDENGCIGTSNGEDVLAVSVPYLTATNVRLYPNPAENIIYVDAPTAVNMSISGVDGRMIANYQQVNSADISGLPDGIYLVRIADKENNLILMEKIVKGKL